MPIMISVGGVFASMWSAGESLLGSTPIRAEVAASFFAGDECGGVERGGRVEQDHGVRHGTDGGVFARFVEFFDRACRGGEVAAGRAAAGDDAVGIDAELGGMSAYPADRRLGVANAIDSLHAVPAGDAVVGRDAHDAARGEVTALRLELRRRAARPAAAEEEDDGGPLVARRVTGGFKDVKLEVDVARGLVDVLFHAHVKLRRVGGALS